MLTSLTPHLNLWVERDGRVVLSGWRVRLLEAIAETGSISAAAARLDVQYRLAWDRLNEMEAGLGVALVERRVGGPGGGGARLTPEGADLAARFNRFAEAIESATTAHFDDLFADQVLAPV
jgi:molybdate transport system regulatory protein